MKIFKILRWPLSYARHGLFRWVVVAVLSFQLAWPGLVQAELTVEKERELGETFYRLVQKRYPIISDPFIREYVTSVGNRIMKVVGPQPFVYRFNVIQEEAYNAFAGPGGYVFINSGLMMDMESEDELAGLIGHEIAHVESRHIAERIARESRIGLATIAGIVAGVFLGAAGGSADLGSAITVGALAAGQTVSLAYSRTDESEADDKGIKWIIKAGYTPLGLRAVLARIRSKQWIGSEQFPTYMSTHPGTEERIAYVDSWLQHRPTRVPLSVTDAFELAKLRLIALYKDIPVAAEYFKTRFGNDADGARAHFGYGLLMARTGNYTAALEHLRIGLRWRPLDPYMLADIGKTHFLTGDYKAAAQVLAIVTQRQKDHSEAFFYYGRSLMALGQHDQATTAFLRLLEGNSRYPQAHRFLGEAYNALGRQALAHFELGLHYRDLGDRRNATYHFEQALKQKPEPAVAEKIRTELAALKKPSES